MYGAAPCENLHCSTDAACSTTHGEHDCAVAAVDLPADACSDPPAPLVPLPTDTTTSPPRPFAAAAPLPSSTLPLLPPLLDPELNISTPLLPASPPFTLRITTAPDVDAVPSPDDTVTAPPVAAFKQLPCDFI